MLFTKDFEKTPCRSEQRCALSHKVIKFNRLNGLYQNLPTNELR